MQLHFLWYELPSYLETDCYASYLLSKSFIRSFSPIEPNIET